VQVRCSHLDTIDPARPEPLDVCPTCVAMGSRWVHLRQCLECGATNCCDSSPNRHATAHFRETAHPLMRSLEGDETWAWCFVEGLTLEPDDDGTLVVVDPFFDAGVWYAREAIKGGTTLPFRPGTTGGDGFPLHTWESTYRRRHDAGTLDPDQRAELEAIPGWRW
jgi:CPA2 family monovalent cation:H+ antiporter-2